MQKILLFTFLFFTSISQVLASDVVYSPINFSDISAGETLDNPPVSGSEKIMNNGTWEIDRYCAIKGGISITATSTSGVYPAVWLVGNAPPVWHISNGPTYASVFSTITCRLPDTPVTALVGLTDSTYDKGIQTSESIMMSKYGLITEFLIGILCIFMILKLKKGSD